MNPLDRPLLRSALLLAAGACAVTTLRAAATNAAWNVNADGDWANTANWNPAVSPGDTAATINPDTATFGAIITAARTVTVDANRNLAGINFAGNSSAYNLSGGSLVLSSGGTIQTSGAGTAHTDAIASPLTLANADAGTSGSQTFAANSTTAARLLSLGAVSGAATAGSTVLTLTGSNTGGNAINGVIADGAGGGTLSVVKSGAGRWGVSATNTFSGGTTIQAGLLAVSVASGSTSQLGTGAITLGDSSGTAAATLTFENSNTNLPNSLIVAAGSSGVKMMTAGFISGPNFAGPITLNDHFTISTLVSNSSTNQTFTLGGTAAVNLNDKTLTLALDRTGTSTAAAITVNRPVGGTGVIKIVGAGTSTSTVRTANLSGTNTYTGGTVVGGTTGTATTKSLTVNLSGNQGGATGGWAIDVDNGATQVDSIVNFNAGSSVAVAAVKSITLGGTGGHFGARTLNAAGTVTNDGALLVRRVGTVNVTGAWTQNGAATVATQGGGVANLNINTGGNFTYAGTGNFLLVTSGSTNIATTLSLNGGTFTTGMPFHNTNAAAVSNNFAVIALNNGGTLKLSANVADLFTTAGASIAVRLGQTGDGGIVDTNGFDTTLSIPVGELTAQSGKLTKRGDGTLTLAAANTYTGNTTVEAGTLALSQASLADASTLRIVEGAKVHLGHAGSDTVAALVLGDTPQGPGTYNATSHPAFFAGSGSIVVPSTDPFVDWIALFPAITVPADKTKEADPDHDGLSNLMEFAFQGDPSAGAVSGKVVSKVANISGDNYLTLTLPLRTGAVFSGSGPLTATRDGVNYAIGGSADLAGFTAAVVEVTPALADGLPVLSPASGWEYRSFRLIAPVGVAAGGFLRAGAEAVVVP